MALPVPEPGLVIRYAYLWRDEHRRGQDEGTKDRPCVIVNVFVGETRDRIIRVAPITRAVPRDGSLAIEIPDRVKRHLGLKDDRQWIVTNETNRFTWPGPDLRPIPTQRPNQTFAYGLLPGNMFRRLRDAFVTQAREHRDQAVNRDAPA